MERYKGEEKTRNRALTILVMAVINDHGPVSSSEIRDMIAKNHCPGMPKVEKRPLQHRIIRVLNELNEKEFITFEVEKHHNNLIVKKYVRRNAKTGDESPGHAGH